MLNKLFLIFSLLLSVTANANVKYCNDPDIVSRFEESKTNTDAVIKCSEESKKVNLGFQGTRKVIFVLDKDIDNKIFYFSFPMMHKIDFYKYQNNMLIESKSYSKINNKGNEYIYFNNIGQTNNTLIALTNTQNSIQLPYKIFDNNDQFQSFIKDRWFFDGIWFGVVLFTVLLTFAFYYIRKKTVIIYYTMHIAALFTIQLAFSGYLFSTFNFLPSYLLNRAVVLACGILTFGTVGLIYKTFKDQLPKNRVIKAYGYVMGVAVLHFISSIMFYNQTIIKFTSYLTLLLSVSSISICIYAIAKRLKHSSAYLLSFSLFLFSSLAFTLKDLGIMDINEIQANYLVKISLLVEIFILGAVMVRTLFEEARIISNASMHQMITNGNIRIIRKLQHDIDSPLTSLEFFMLEAKKYISEDLRLMGKQSLNRIQDIINTLKINEEDSILEESDKRELVAIYPLLKRIVSEKRNEYKNRSDVHISLDTYSSRDYFVEIRKSDFNRAISNIINNSVEAQRPNSPIYIVLHVENNNKNVEIVISDNGKGIESKYISEIFEYGKSFDKNSSGIGLNQAKEYIESESGNIIIDSCVDQGTTLKISLNEVQPPTWYTSEIQSTSKQIVVLDDDDSIHNLWEEKLSSRDFSITHLKSSEDFYKWSIGHNINDYFFLIDLELINSSENGLDLISEFHMQNRSTLVTSHFMDKDVQSRCERLGVKMIPKESVLNIQVKFKAHSSPKEIVLIDDDKFTHLNWKRATSKNDIKLSSFYSIEDFLKNSKLFPLNTPIYVDSNLGNGIKGEVESEKIFKAGFKNIILATGFSKKDINVPYWIQSIQGKAFTSISL